VAPGEISRFLSCPLSPLIDEESLAGSVAAATCTRPSRQVQKSGKSNIAGGKGGKGEKQTERERERERKRDRKR